MANNIIMLVEFKVAYNADKIYKLKKITEIYNNHCEIKKDLQLCIDFGCKNF